MSSGFNLQYDNQKATKVVFAAGGDGEMEDEGLNPPFVRDRWTDQSAVFLSADKSNQVNPQANTSQWNIGSDNSGSKSRNNFFTNHIKKFTPTYIQMGLYTPCINPKNNIIEFQIEGEGSTYVATIRPNNYTRMITDYCNPPYPVYPTLGTYDVEAANDYEPYIYNCHGDPDDGIIDYILFALNNAVEKTTGAAYNPAAGNHGQFVANFSNGYKECYRYRDQGTGINSVSGNALFGLIRCQHNVGGQPLSQIKFRFTGGNTFQRGINAWGCAPLPVFYPVITAANVISVTNVALSGLQTIDGVVLVANNRVLLINQSVPSQNGLWLAQVGAWTRPADFAPGNVAGNGYLSIISGTTYSGTTWRCVSTTAIINIDPITFISYSIADTYYYFYPFGPCQFKYSRYVDVCMPELTQFSKAKNSGTGVPSSLLARLYFDGRPSIIGTNSITLDTYRQQQINLRKDYALSYLTLELRDEYGELYDLPQGLFIPWTGLITDSFSVSWPNAQGVDMALVTQL